MFSMNIGQVSLCASKRGSRMNILATCSQGGQRMCVDVLECLPVLESPDSILRVVSYPPNRVSSLVTRCWQVRLPPPLRLLGAWVMCALQLAILTLSATPHSSNRLHTPCNSLSVILCVVGPRCIGWAFVVCFTCTSCCFKNQIFRNLLNVLLEEVLKRGGLWCNFCHFCHRELLWQ